MQPQLLSLPGHNLGLVCSPVVSARCTRSARSAGARPDVGGSGSFVAAWPWVTACVAAAQCCSRLTRQAQADSALRKARVQSRGRKGLGVVATEPLERGELILEEAPLLTFQDQSFDVLFGDLQEILADDRAFEHWDESLKQSVQSNFSEESASKFWDLADTCGEEKTALGIARTNALGLTDESAGLFLNLSRFNHSCRPNVHHSWQEDRGIQVLKAVRDIPQGEELCISYLSFLTLCAPRRERLGELSDRFGFDCECEACARSSANSDWQRERLSQLCAAFAEEKAEDEVKEGIEGEGEEGSSEGEEGSERKGERDAIWLNLRRRMPLFFEVQAEELTRLSQELERPASAAETVVERLELKEALRETVALVDAELNGSPAAKALVFFGAFRHACQAGRGGAAKSLVRAAWRQAVLAEGGDAWRARRLAILGERANAQRALSKCAVGSTPFNG
ncbi:unnamed protein product, partial [Effrenium voratum]